MTEFTPADISFAIQQVNFTGRTGPISFIPQTAIRRESYYYLMQYQNSSDSVLVGSSVGTNGSLVLNVSAMVFPGGRIPVSGKNNYHYYFFTFLEIVPQLPTLSDAYAAVFFGVFIAILLLDLAVATWVILNWSDKTLRRSSPLFLLLINVGIASILVAGIIMAIGLSDSAMCILYVFFLVTGLTLVIASLLCKNWRIYRIFSNSRADSVNISDIQLVGFTAFLLALTWIQFFVFSFAGGIITLTRMQGKNNPFYVFDLCESPTAWFQTFQIIFYYTYCGLLFLLTAIVGLWTRSVNKHYNESSAIAVIIYIYVCIAIIFIPLYYVQGASTDSQTTRFIIVSIAITILMLSTLLILFFAKILQVSKNHRNRNIQD